MTNLQKDVSEFDTLDELKKDIKEKMVEANNNKAKAELEEAVISAAIESTKMDVPAVMVEK